MKPALSLQDVQTQLLAVDAQLHHFSDVQNRLLSAAITAMPRTTVLYSPQLFSGQIDISNLSFDHFDMQMLECPLNYGPEPLVMAFTTSMETFKPGSIITNKMVWSFADSLHIAKHYHNGLILIADPLDNES